MSTTEADCPSPSPADDRSGADGESFLQRWSARKQQARQTSSSESAPAEMTPDEVELTDADLPSIESLDENSDYRPFLAPRISPELRRLALRKLFHLPQFNVRDGLNDYDEDYTRFAGQGPVIGPAMQHVLDLAGQCEQPHDAVRTGGTVPAAGSDAADAAADDLGEAEA